MKNLTWLIVLSLAANVLLVGLWAKNRSSKHVTSGVEMNKGIASAKNSWPVAGADETLSTASKSSSADSTSSWKDIQSDDLKEFIRRLRASGCPEETVRDIILAEVNRRYSARNRELWPDQFADRPYWKAQRSNRDEIKTNRERWRKQQELQKEKSALLVELLGVDPEKERRRENGEDEPMNWQDQRIAFLPEAKREAVLKYLEEFDDKQQDFYERTRGMWDAESRAEQRQLEADKMQGLAQFLTPQELREYDLRQSQTAQQMSWEMRGLSLSRGEYEDMFDIRKKYGDSIYNYADIESKEGRDQVEANKKAMQADIVAALGADKAKSYERSQDYSYQQLAQLSKKNDLPADTATKIYDFKETAEQNVKQLAEDKNLTDEQRTQALQGIRAETEKTIKQSLGETLYKRYLRRGGWWINNLAPTPPPKPGG